MAYTPTQWATGEKISSVKMNKLEQGVADAQPALVSGTNIKTINNQSLLGSGNIDVSGEGSILSTFPTDAAIAAMPNGTYFETKGYYAAGDGGQSAYTVSKSWTANSFKITYNGTTIYVRPLCENNNLELVKFGLREGQNYGDTNDAVMNRLVVQFGRVLVFPSGHYYFNSSFNAGASQLSIQGSGCSFTTDKNTSGNTWLHFENVADGGYAISMGAGFIADVILAGDPEKNNVSIDRTKTYIAPDEIATVVNSRNTKGLSAASTCKDQQCGVPQFPIWNILRGGEHLYP